MVFILPALFILSLIGIKFQKCNSSENTYLTKDSTNSIRGIFIVLIFTSTFIGTMTAINKFDGPMVYFVQNYEQLLYVPFFFYSGFGIFETFKLNGKQYARRIPLQQILRHFMSYLIAWALLAMTALALHSNYSIQDYLLSLIGMSDIGNPSNWFVFVMIILYFFTYISFRVADKKTAIISITILTIFLFFMYRTFAPAGSPYQWNVMPAYIFGVFYSYLKERIEPFLFKKKYIRFLVMFVSFGCLVGTIYLIKYLPYQDFRNAAFLFPSFFMSVFFISFTSIFNVRSKILRFLGANSFWIFILQNVSLIWLTKVGFIYEHTYLYFVAGLLITILLGAVLNKAFNFFWNIFAQNHGNASEDSNIKLGIAISYLSLLVSGVAAFVVTPRVLENLGDAQYGLFAFANSITAWLTVITSALAASYIRFASKYHSEHKDVGIVNTSYFRIFAISSLSLFALIAGALGIMYGCGFQLGQYTAEENKMIIILILISGSNVAINVMFSVFNSFLTFKKQFIFLRLLALVISVLTFVSNLIFSFVTKHVLSVAIVAVTMTSISSLITIIFAFRKEKMTFAHVGYRQTSPLLRAIIIFSGFILLNAIVDRVNSELDKTLLGIMVNAEAVTDYTLSKYFNTYFVALCGAIVMSYIPSIHELVAKDPKIIVSAYYDELVQKEKELYDKELAEYRAFKKSLKETFKTDKKAAKEKLLEAKAKLLEARKTYKEKCLIAKKQINTNMPSIKAEIKEKENKKELSSLFLKICRSQMFVMFLVGGGFFAVGFEFMNLWLGAEKEYIYYYALIPLSLDMFALTVNSCIEIQRALNKHKFRAVLYICLASVNVIISIIMIKIFPPGYQIWGAFIGTAFSVVVGNIIILNVYNKVKIGLPMGSYFISMVKYILYAGVGVAAAILLRVFLGDRIGVAAKFLLQGIAFVIIYMVMLLIFERKTSIALLKKVGGKVKSLVKTKA